MKNDNPQFGFTLIEILVVLSVAATLSVMVVPSLQSLVIKHSLSNAEDNVAAAFRRAKLTARAENTNIRVEFNEGSDLVQLKLPNDTVLQSIKLSGVTADNSVTFRFNALGTVNAVGDITLVSNQDSNRTTQVRIDTLFGQIKLG